MLANAEINSAVFAGVINPIISSVVIPIVELMFAVAVIVFVYSIIVMVIKSGDETARAQAKQHMLYGVIGMFIMVSAWGIIYLISNTVKSIDKPNTIQPANP